MKIEIEQNTSWVLIACCITVSLCLLFGFMVYTQGQIKIAAFKAGLVEAPDSAATTHYAKP